ncbi:MAG: hypothetical protein JKY24_07370 [Pseudomonadales bacterium]|nr:hypothetical protein [Pseudomonadales bacterium]
MLDVFLTLLSFSAAMLFGLVLTLLFLFLFTPFYFVLIKDVRLYESIKVVRVELLYQRLVIQVVNDSLLTVTFFDREFFSKTVKKKSKDKEDWMSESGRRKLKALLTHRSSLWETFELVVNWLDLYLVVEGKIGAGYPDRTAILEPLTRLARHRSKRFEVALYTSYLEDWMDAQGMLYGNFIPFKLYRDGRRYYRSEKWQLFLNDFKELNDFRNLNECRESEEEIA